MHVVLADLSANRLDAVAGEIRAAGRPVIPLAVDVLEAARREGRRARMSFARGEAVPMASANTA